MLHLIYFLHCVESFELFKNIGNKVYSCALSKYKIHCFNVRFTACSYCSVFIKNDSNGLLYAIISNSNGSALSASIDTNMVIV